MPAGPNEFGDRWGTAATPGVFDHAPAREGHRGCLILGTKGQPHQPGAGPIVPAALDEYKQNVYDRWVIRTFADGETRRFYAGGKSRRVPTEIQKRAAMRLVQLNAATRIEDLRMPPSNRLEQLHGNRSGQWSIRINDQRRVCL